MNKTLKNTDIKKFLSPYLSEGRKQESWQIDEITIDGDHVDARFSMTSTYLSDTDENGFHLTIFTALEVASQLMIICGHLWAGLTEKSMEAWMVESSVRTVRSIRKPSNIHVEMEVKKARKRGENLFGVAEYRITDEQGGLFEVTLKGFLS